jgi:hypothetical protein
VRGRGRNRKRGFAPLRHPLKGGGESGKFKKGETLLLKISPSPSKERGTQRVR